MFTSLTHQNKTKQKELKKPQPDFQNQSMQIFLIKDVFDDVTYTTRNWKYRESPLIREWLCNN